MVEFSEFECLSSPAAAKLAKQLVMLTKLYNEQISGRAARRRAEDKETSLGPRAWAFDLVRTDALSNATPTKVSHTDNCESKSNEY